MLESSENGFLVVDAETLDCAVRDDLIALDDTSAGLTEAGRAWCRRASAGADRFGAQHRVEAIETRVEAGEAVDVCVNHAESPLSALYRRKDVEGRPFLTQSEFSAGERLRADFTRGNLMPRVTANWEANVASRRPGGGLAELTDAALSARMRVEAAMTAVGPELAGVLVDICCFLKGIETVERERRWPQRSAKIVLKAALAALDRHYRPEAGKGAARPAVLHWGSSDFRPRIAAP